MQSTDVCCRHEFIDLAEQVEAIDALTAFVVDRALQDWQMAPPMTLAVNLSPRCLDDPQLPQQMAKLLEARDAPPSALAFEITEGLRPSDTAMKLSRPTARDGHPARG